MHMVIPGGTFLHAHTYRVALFVLVGLGTRYLKLSILKLRLWHKDRSGGNPLHAAAVFECEHKPQRR